MFVDPVFHVNMLISKLPPSWQNYKNKLMHERVDIKLHILMHHLQVEELAMNKEKKTDPTKKAHVVETNTNR